MMSILAQSAAAGGWVGIIVWMVILFAFMYFLMIRPQKKETQKKAVSQCRKQQFPQ